MRAFVVTCLGGGCRRSTGRRRSGRGRRRRLARGLSAAPTSSSSPVRCSTSTTASRTSRFGSATSGAARSPRSARGSTTAGSDDASLRRHDARCAGATAACTATSTVRAPQRGRDPQRPGGGARRATGRPCLLAARAAGRGGRRRRRARGARRQRSARRPGRRPLARRPPARARPGTIGLLVAMFVRAAGYEVHLLGHSAHTSTSPARSASTTRGPRPSCPVCRTPWSTPATRRTCRKKALELVEPGRRVVYIGLAGSPGLATPARSRSRT